MKIPASDKPVAAEPRRATILDVAALAGVSPATVSNALTGRRPVDSVTRERVAAAALATGYTPNLGGRRLRTGRADTIAILSSMPFAIAGGRARMGFLMEVAAAAAVRALESGIALILVPPLERARAPLADLNIDGALVIEPLAADPDIVLLQHRGIPVVSLGRPGGAPEVPFVEIHSHEGTRLLLEHLRAQGSRQIALMVGAAPRHSYAEAERAYAGFAAATTMPPVIVRVPETGGEAAARAAAAALLRERPGLDALLVAVDAFAVGARAAAADLGLAVPDRLRIATRYDGVLARDCDPALTALDLNLDRLATLGVDLLLDHVAGGRSRSMAEGPLPSLKARQSTAGAVS